VGESSLAWQMEIYVVAAAGAAPMKARRGGFGGRGGSARPKGRFINLSPVRTLAPIAESVAPGALDSRLFLPLQVRTARVFSG